MGKERACQAAGTAHAKIWLAGLGASHPPTPPPAPWCIRHQACLFLCFNLAHSSCMLGKYMEHEGKIPLAIAWPQFSQLQIGENQPPVGAARYLLGPH